MKNVLPSLRGGRLPLADWHRVGTSSAGSGSVPRLCPSKQNDEAAASPNVLLSALKEFR